MSTSQLVSHLKDNLLTCAICDDQYLDPRTLRCLHSFCLRCLQQWSANNGSGESVQCPACRQVTDLGALGGAEGLPRSFFLENLREVVQRFQEVQCIDESMQCFNCSVSNVCKACNIYLCDHCFERHKQDPATREHRTIAAPDSQTIRRERTGSNHRLSRSVSTVENQGGVSLQGLFRRSRSSDRAKGSRNRASDLSRSAERETTRPASFQPNNPVTNGRCSYLIQPRLKHTIRGNNRSVWGVALLSNRVYVITYCASSIDVYDASSYDQLGSISVDGLKDPWDMVSCSRQGSLYVCDWRSKCVFAIRPGDYDDREVIRTKWVQMEHRPRGLSVSGDGRSVLLVCADWRKETTNDSLRVYDVTGTKRPRVTRKVRLSEFGSVWQAVHEPGSDTYLVCHGGRWDRLHRVCRVDEEGKKLAVYGGDAGHGREQLNIPSSISVDSQGQVKKGYHFY